MVCLSFCQEKKIEFYEKMKASLFSSQLNGTSTLLWVNNATTPHNDGFTQSSRQTQTQDLSLHKISNCFSTLSRAFLSETAFFPR